MADATPSTPMVSRRLVVVVAAAAAAVAAAAAAVAAVVVVECNLSETFYQVRALRRLGGRHNQS